MNSKCNETFSILSVTYKLVGYEINVICRTKVQEIGSVVWTA